MALPERVTESAYVILLKLITWKNNLFPSKKQTQVFLNIVLVEP